MVLLPLYAGHNHHRVFLHLGLLEEGSRKYQCQLEKILVGTYCALSTLQHENAFAEPLNGPLWYLPAILIMHLMIDGCRKTRHLHLIMIGLCIVSYFLYAANKEYEFLPNLTPMGLFRRLPYYYLR